MIVLDGLRRAITALAFGHDGRELIAGGGYEKPVETWDPLAGSVNREPTQLSTSASDPLAINPRFGWKYASAGYGTFCAQAPNGAWAIGIELGSPVYAQATAFGVRSDGERVVVGYDHSCLLAAFAQAEFQKPELLWHRPTDPGDMTGTRRVRGVAYFPTADVFAVLEVIYMTGGLSRFTIRDGETGDIRETVPVPSSEPGQLCISPDGAAVVVRCGQVLNVWDATDFARPPTRVQNDNRKHFSRIAYHPSGRYLAAASRDETVKLFDTRTWKVARTFTWNVGKLRSIAFSPDGTRAAVGSETGKIVLWDVDA
jgi:WD40 repeat protein